MRKGVGVACVFLINYHLGRTKERKSYLRSAEKGDKEEAALVTELSSYLWRGRTELLSYDYNHVGMSCPGWGTIASLRKTESGDQKNWRVGKVTGHLPCSLCSCGLEASTVSRTNPTHPSSLSL